MRSQGLELFISCLVSPRNQGFRPLLSEEILLGSPFVKVRKVIEIGRKILKSALLKNSSFLFPSLKKRVKGELDNLTASYPRIYPSPVWRCRCSSSATLRDLIPPVLFL